MGSKSKAPGHKSHVKRKRSASHTPDKGTYVQREHKDRLSGLYSGTGRNCFNYIMRLTNRIMTMRQSLLSRHWKTYSIWAIKMMWRFCWNRFCSWGEHQSSWNPNMPLRGLLYFSSMYQDYVTGKNRKLMESCRPLHDYSLFVHRIREKLAEGYRPERAVDLAVEQCLREGVLSEELSASRKEVVGMFLEEYDAELHERTLREEGRQEGRREGMQAGSRMMAELAKRLRADDRMEDFWKAVEDEKFCRRLLEEYGMNMTL